MSSFFNLIIQSLNYDLVCHNFGYLMSQFWLFNLIFSFDSDQIITKKKLKITVDFGFIGHALLHAFFNSVCSSGLLHAEHSLHLLSFIDLQSSGVHVHLKCFNKE